MIKLLQLSLAILLLLACMPVFAQVPDRERDDVRGDFLDSVPFTDESDEPFANSYPEIHCDLCRDPFEYPMDYVAFYYNGHALLGEGPYRDSTYYLIKITYGDASQFILAWTDIPTDIDGSMFFPTQLITIRLRFPDGQVSSWVTLLNQPNLSIGESEAEVENDDEYDDEHEDDRDESRFWDNYWADWEESHDIATRQLDCYADFSDPMNTRIICNR